MKYMVLSRVTVASVIVVLSVNAWAYEMADALPDGVKFYGKVNVSLQRNHDFDRTANPANNNIFEETKLLSNASRIGMKGKYGLNEDISFIYKGELELDANSGYNAQNTFVERREMYAGISSKKFGSVIGGKIDTPLKMLQSKVDIFSDVTPGDMKYLMPGKTRDSNTYLYQTPTWNGITAAYSTIDFKSVPASSEPYYEHGESMSLVFEKNGFYAGIARNQNVRDYDINRIALQYKYGAFTFGVLAQDAHRTPPGKTFPTGDRKENGHVFNVAWKATEKDTLKLQWGKSQEVEYNGNIKVIGVDHQFSKRLKAYVFHGDVGGDPYQTAAPARQKDRTLMANGIGVEYSF